MDAGTTRVKIVTHRRSCHYNYEDFTFFRDLHDGSFCGLDTFEGRHSQTQAHPGDLLRSRERPVFSLKMQLSSLRQQPRRLGSRGDIRDA